MEIGRYIGLRYNTNSRCCDGETFIHAVLLHIQGVGLSPEGSLDSILDKIMKTKGVNTVTVVSRSGMHVAGKAPEGVHVETFVAMSAIVLGASETAASELAQNLQFVDIITEKAKLLLCSLGKKGILVVSTKNNSDSQEILSSISKNLKAIEGFLE